MPVSHLAAGAHTRVLVGQLRSGYSVLRDILVRGNGAP